MGRSNDSNVQALHSGPAARAPLMTTLTRVLRACENFFFFVLYRTLHSWANAGRSVRALTGVGQERWWSHFGYAWRYVTTALSIWLTYLTIRASQQHDREAERRLVLWGLIPAAFRTLSALWTSTIDRQLAIDAEIRNLTAAHVINEMRLAGGIPVDALGLTSACNRRTRRLARGGADYLPPNVVVKVAHGKFTLWAVLCKGIEIPINYLVQKALVLILLVLFFWPDLLPGRWTTGLNVYSRWARIGTMVLLAPLNHYLGILRVAAFNQIEDNLIAKLCETVAVLERRAAQSSSTEQRRAIASALDIAERIDRLTLEQTAKLGERSLAIVQGAEDDRHTDELLQNLWRAHHRLKLYRRGLSRVRATLDALPAWAALRATVAAWPAAEAGVCEPSYSYEYEYDPVPLLGGAGRDAEASYYASDEVYSSAL